jgi:phospholipase C
MPRIEHVVLIVEENHTFDNYFGTFPGVDGLHAVSCAESARGRRSAERSPLATRRGSSASMGGPNSSPTTCDFPQGSVVRARH